MTTLRLGPQAPCHPELLLPPGAAMAGGSSRSSGGARHAPPAGWGAATTGNVAHVNVRPRLLVISLVTALVVSLGVGWAIARTGGDSSSDGVSHIDATDATGPAVTDDLRPPTIGTNAVVKGKPLPDVAVQTLQGDAVQVSSLKGQPMVINVWGSTCVPCKQELPAFAAAHLQYGDTVRFVGIDYLGASDREEQFARDKGVQYELLYDSNGEFIVAVGITTFPVTLFVRADGTIVKQTGLLDEGKLTSIIESELL